ncbi:MAG: ferritin-like domain-containing protein [Bacteroidetes bacterium]|nr:ferritin-like domain-containing protein [Bacteroidota bacterium]
MPKTNTATRRSTSKTSQAAAKTSKTGRSAKTSKASQSSKASSKPRANTPVQDSKLREFFLDELKDIYWAEQKLVKTLPKLQKAASSEELKTAFESHLEETKTHVQRLEQAFKILGEKAVAKKCDAMQGITEEGSSVIEDTDEGTATRDVALVMAGQKAEHYEIATYGGLIQIATTLGEDDLAELLKETLEEEKNADQKLTEIAEGGINYQASEESEED